MLLGLINSINVSSVFYDKYFCSLTRAIFYPVTMIYVVDTQGTDVIHPQADENQPCKHRCF